MRDNIMFYPAIVLMIAEAVASAFLIWAWRDAKKKGDGEDGISDQEAS